LTVWQSSDLLSDSSSPLGFRISLGFEKVFDLNLLRRPPASSVLNESSVFHSALPGKPTVLSSLVAENLSGFGVVGIKFQNLPPMRPRLVEKLIFVAPPCPIEMVFNGVFGKGSLCIVFDECGSFPVLHPFDESGI
jgi:hypothetical protein